MTPLQRARFYFPAWNAACRAQDWRLDRGRFLCPRRESWGSPTISNLYHQVMDAAAALAQQNHRAIAADDLRHACHHVALGHPKSSAILTNAQTDTVVALFRLLADPNDITAVEKYFDPAFAARERILWTLEYRFPDAYVAHLSSGIFGTSDWRSLTTDNLRSLEMTLFKRAKDKAHSQALPDPPSPSDPSDNEPF